MKIMLIRHGKTDFNKEGRIQGHLDPPLNEEGVEEARRTAMSIKKEVDGFTVIYCGPLKRTVMTAEIISEVTGLPVIIDKRLISRDLGKFSGMKLEDIKRNYPEHIKKWFTGDPDFRPPNGESNSELYDRVSSFISDIFTEHGNGTNIIAVTHREIINAIYLLIYGRMLPGGPYKLRNCDIITVELKEKFISRRCRSG